LDDRALHGTVQTLMPAALFNSFGSGLGNSGLRVDVLKDFFQGDEAKTVLAKQFEQMSGVKATVLDDVMPALAEAMADAMSRVTGVAEPSSPAGDAHELGAAIGGMMAAMMGLAPEPPKPASETEQGLELMQSWFDAGREAQADYINAMKAAFAPRD
jgi:hypothetical protein